MYSIPRDAVCLKLACFSSHVCLKRLNILISKTWAVTKGCFPRHLVRSEFMICPEIDPGTHLFVINSGNWIVQVPLPTNLQMPTYKM